MPSQRRIVRAGKVWTPEGFRDEVDIVIENGRIAELAARGTVALDGADVVEAHDLIALPGLIDTHGHHREPGFTAKEDIESATRAAAMGGVTTAIGMPNVQPPVTTAAIYRDVIELYKQKAYVDFNMNPTGTVPAEAQALAEAGALGFKVWMVEDTKRSYPHMPGLGVHRDDHLLEIFEAVAPTGRPLLVHPHNQDLMSMSEERERAKGDTSPMAYGRAQRFYDGIVWDTAIATLVRMQQAVGTRLHVLHLITVQSVEMVRRAKAAGRAVTAEVNPFGLFLGDVPTITERGPYVMGRLVPDDTKDALWAGLVEGVIDVVGTDHAPHTIEEKEIGWQDMWASPSGTPQLQDYLSQLLDVGVNERGLSLDQLVRVTSYNPARIFGLYPRKGTVEVGADADLALIDPDLVVTFRDEDALSKCGWTPYRGQRRGGVRHTLVRGEFVVRDRTITGTPGFGEHVTPQTV